MNLSNCPRCNDTFRVPQDHLSPDTYAQCPWCGETFPLSEVFDRLPPVLIILSADGSPVDAMAHSVGAVSEGASQRLQHDIDGFVRAENVAIDETVAFMDDSSMNPGSIGLSNDRVDPSLGVTPVRRKKSGGGLRSLFGMVAGALLAVPIAGAIMWALGIGYFADSGGQRSNSVASKAIAMSQDRKPKVSVPTTNDVTSEPNSELSDEFEMPTNLDPDPLVASEPAESELSMPQETETDLALQDVTVVDPEPKWESKELVDTIGMGIKMIGRIDDMSADNEKRQWALTVTYRTLAKAGALAESNGSRLQELARAIKSSQIMDDLEAACEDWMDTKKRDNNGIILIGQSDGGTVTLGSGKKVTVSGVPSLPASGRVLVIGQILDSRSVNGVLVESLP